MLRWGEKAINKLRLKEREAEDNLESETRKLGTLVKNLKKLDRDCLTVGIKLEHGRKNEGNMKVITCNGQYTIILIYLHFHAFKSAE